MPMSVRIILASLFSHWGHLCFLLRVIQGCLKLDIHLLSLVEGIQTLVWAHIIKF